MLPGQLRIGGDLAVAVGTVTGNALTWSSKVTQPMPMDVEFTATIDGSSISGNAKSQLGSAPFSGNRV